MKKAYAGEEGVVEPATTLSINNDRVPLTPLLPKVMLLKVATRFVKSVPIQQIMVHVCGVEELRD